MDSQQITHPILRKILNMILLAINYYLVRKKVTYILALKG